LKIAQHLTKLKEDHLAAKTRSNCTNIFSFGGLFSTRRKSGNRRPFRQLEKPSLEVASTTLVYNLIRQRPTAAAQPPTIAHVLTLAVI